MNSIFYNSSCDWCALADVRSVGKAQKDEGKPRASLSLLTKAEKDDMQLPIKWFDCPRTASST
jgi:hypothetical protein